MFETPTPGTYGNRCAPNFDTGKNQSPELSWNFRPQYTMSFAVIAFDDTAQVYHWGMYNIPVTTLTLPENASVLAMLPENAGKYGQQVTNYSGNLGYIGPCPPRDEPPLVHDYTFTVYALYRTLNGTELPRDSSAEALANVLTRVRKVATATITGKWSSTTGCPPNCGSQ
jgi:Raf kinase inhibitor-like YbhB/YbcL family protein